MRSPVNSREQTLSEGPVNTGNNDPVTIARTVYRAYVNKDRALMGPLGSEAFYFNSPLDNRLDRAIYFARCWPSGRTTSGFKLAYCVQDRDKVFSSYEVPGDSGRAIRNTEQLTIRDRKLVAAGVYFGWSLLHEVPAGGDIGLGIVARRSSGVHA